MLAGLLCIPAFHALSQGQTHQLVDFVEVNIETPEGKDTLCIKNFLENWAIDPTGPSVSKRVLDYDTACSDLFNKLPLKNGSISIRNISYEFRFLDPHLVASGNRAFPEPDSMDGPSRQLQQEMVSLVSLHGNAGKMYDLSDQLLSVVFHETWSVDPATFAVSKQVRAVTPMIWQRRQTESGEPINEASTGLPVYYKIALRQISLRNP